MVKMLHIANAEPSDRIWIPPFIDALQKLGDLTIIEHGNTRSAEEIAELIRATQILLTGWNSVPVPLSIAQDQGRLEYICNVTGSIKSIISQDLIEAGIPVTNWGDAPAFRLAEGAFALLLAVARDIPGRLRTIAAGGWKPGDEVLSDTLEDMNIGIYGMGVIGLAFEAMLRSFRAVVRVYDPYAETLPEPCIRVNTLDELFAQSETLVVHAGLSDETRGSITAELLARLPDYGIVINTARGAIFDQEALFAELERGRLRAGLDVLWPDRLPGDHPARTWPNVIFTAHEIGKVTPHPGEPPKLDSFHHICLENIHRHCHHEPLRFLFDVERYIRST